MTLGRLDQVDSFGLVTLPNALSKLRVNHVIGRNSILTHLSAVNHLPKFALGPFYILHYILTS